LNLANSIIDQPSNRTLDYGGNGCCLRASYVMLLDANTFPVASDTIVAAEPTFVDAANGDYHLRATSWGLDFAPVESSGPSNDLDGNLRNVDLLQVPNRFGARDLGAYELRYVCAADTIFCDGFEAYP
jgi:hypothetical protein